MRFHWSVSARSGKAGIKGKAYHDRESSEHIPPPDVLRRDIAGFSSFAGGSRAGKSWQNDQAQDRRDDCAERKAAGLRAFSELGIVGRTSGVHSQDGECSEEVVSRLWHIFEESEPGDEVSSAGDKTHGHDVQGSIGRH